MKRCLQILSVLVCLAISAACAFLHADDTATVTIAVTQPAEPPNESPNAGDAAVETPRDTALVINLAASDPEGDPIEYRIVGLPEHGILTDSDGQPVMLDRPLPTNEVTYIPSTGYTGADSIRFAVRPASGATPPPEATLFVSAIGDDAGDGGRDAPFKTVQRAADMVQPGDVVLIRAGVYVTGGRSSARLRLSRSGTPDKPITFVGEDGAILDGQGAKSIGISAEPTDAVHDIVLRNLTVTGFTSRGLYARGIHHWLIEDCRFNGNTGSNNGWGANIFGNEAHPTSHLVIRQCEFGDNGRTGLMLGNKALGLNASYVLVEDCIAWNNGNEGTRIQGQGFNAQTDEPDPLPDGWLSPVHHITFRDCIGWNNRSSFIETADARDITVEGCIGWRYLNECDSMQPPLDNDGRRYASFFDSGDGDIYKFGLHSFQRGILIRDCVAFDGYHAGIQFARAYVTAEHNVLIDCGEREGDWRGNFLGDNGIGMFRNNACISTFVSTTGRKDARCSSASRIDSDYNYYSDGSSFKGFKPVGVTECDRHSVLVGIHGLNIAAVRVAARDWEQGLIDRQQLRARVRTALGPTPSSVLYQAGCSASGEVVNIGLSQ